MEETLKEIKSNLGTIFDLVSKIIDNEAKSKILLSLEDIDLELIKDLVIDYSCNPREPLNEKILA
ncbi:MAG: hypothetical protein NT139_00920, partial [Candidatus Woesearchaeota archaeon]|nr:hypothetical protein [Candidatus Woesearchaeota archaeon]